jgi:hypothetical protein
VSNDVELSRDQANILTAAARISAQLQAEKGIQHVDVPHIRFTLSPFGVKPASGLDKYEVGRSALGRYPETTGQKGSTGAVIARPSLPRPARVSSKVMEHVNNFPYVTPPHLAQGSPEAAKWLQDAKNRYLNALVAMATAMKQEDAIEAVIQKRNHEGKPLSPEEEKDLKEKNDAVRKTHAEAKNFVDGFRQQQTQFRRATLAATDSKVWSTGFSPLSKVSNVSRYTISEDNTQGDDARNSALLAALGKKMRCPIQRDTGMSLSSAFPSQSGASPGMRPPSGMGMESAPSFDYCANFPSGPPPGMSAPSAALPPGVQHSSSTQGSRPSDPNIFTHQQLQQNFAQFGLGQGKFANSNDLLRAYRLQQMIAMNPGIAQAAGAMMIGEEHKPF